MNWAFVTAIVERHDAVLIAFKVGRNANISFEVGEFAAVMGLQCNGIDVVENRQEMADSMKRIFEEPAMKPSSLTCPRIVVKMFELVARGD